MGSRASAPVNATNGGGRASPLGAGHTPAAVAAAGSRVSVAAPAADFASARPPDPAPPRLRSRLATNSSVFLDLKSRWIEWNSLGISNNASEVTLTPALAAGFFEREAAELSAEAAEADDAAAVGEAEAAAMAGTGTMAPSSVDPVEWIPIPLRPLRPPPPPAEWLANSEEAALLPPPVTALDSPCFGMGWGGEGREGPVTD